MDRSLPGAVRVPADPLPATVDFLERLGFRLEEIAPADDPAEALMTGHGLRLRLERTYRGEAELVLTAGGTLAPGRYFGPGKLVVEVVAPGAVHVPPAPPTFLHSRPARPIPPGRARRCARGGPGCSTAICCRRDSAADGSPATSAPAGGVRSTITSTTIGSGSS